METNTNTPANGHTREIAEATGLAYNALATIRHAVGVPVLLDLTRAELASVKGDNARLTEENAALRAALSILREPTRANAAAIASEFASGAPSTTCPSTR